MQGYGQGGGPEGNDPIVGVWLVAGPWQVRGRSVAGPWQVCGGPVATYGWRDVTLLCARSRIVVCSWAWFQVV